MTDAKKALVDMLKGDSHAFMLFREEAEVINAAWAADRERAEKAEARVKVLESALWELDAVGCDFGYYEQAAKTMKSIISDAIDAMSQIKPAKVSSAAQSQFLTEAEKKAQAGRCSCRGSAARAAKEQS